MADLRTSLPSRERGLKSCDPADGVFVGAVAPFTGAWIEILWPGRRHHPTRRRSLHGSVD